MPRKKNLSPVEPEVQSSTTKSTPRSTKPKAKVEPATDKVEKTASKSSKKAQVSEIASVPDAKPTSRRVVAKKKEEIPVETANPVSQKPPTGAQKATTIRRSKAPTAKSEPTTEDFEGLMVSFREEAPKQGTKLPAKAKQKNVSKTEAVEVDISAATPEQEWVVIEGFEAEQYLLSWRTSAPSQKKSTKKPTPQAQTTSAEEQGTESRRPSRRERKKQRETVSASESGAESTADFEDIEGITFRSKGDAESSLKTAPTRRERPAKDKPKAEPKAAPVFVRPEPPTKPVKPRIQIPAEAPRVVLRNGVPTLVRNHRVYPPFAFFGSASDERRAENVLEQIKRAGEAGVHLHSHLVEFEVDPASVDSSVAFAAYMLSKTLEQDKEAQVLFRIVFITPNRWEEKFPHAKYLNQAGKLAEPSVCDDEYWNVAQACLQDFIKKIRSMPHADRILGLHLERGEWFHSEDWGYDTSHSAATKFREWALMRYQADVVALRAAWFDGSVTFDELRIPTYQRPSDGGKFMRVNRKERRWVDYHLFLSDATAERIADLAYSTKESSEGNFLVGVSYGYTFEWSHPASGHLSLGKVLRCEEIDFVCGPPSYRTREPGGTAPFPTPIDSLALNGKLFISEEDFKTSISSWREPDDFNPVIKTPQALENVHYRGAGMALAHTSGICWMDLWGNGWLNTPNIWERAEHIREDLIRRMGTPVTDPDVAVFIDERALAYLVDQASFALLVQNVRESVLRSGLSAGFYLLSDLAHRENFPESKLYIMLNAWDIRPELRAAIKSKLQRDNKVLFWLYGAGIFDSGREALERSREITGIALKPQPYSSKAGTTLLNRRHPLCEAFGDLNTIGGNSSDPSYFAIPEQAVVLGEYTQTGLPSFVIKEHREGDRTQHWTSVFMGEPVVTPGLVRALGQIAGAHIWNFHNDVVHVRAPFLSVHCTMSGPRTITLPSNWAAYNINKQEWASTDSTSIRFTSIDGVTHNFLVGVRSEIEEYLSLDQEALLTMSELPAQSENTVRYDSMNFDVPVMRLNEWMDENLSDDVVDELFLPRNLFEGSEESPDTEETDHRVGRNRRKRRTNDRRDKSTEMPGFSFRSSGEVNEDGDLDMNVMFRARD